MFAPVIWSVLLLIAPIPVYRFIIRPRLQSKLTDLYADIDSFWGRVWTRFNALATFWVATAGAVLTAIPDILVQIAPLDFSPWLPQPWAAYTGPACAIIITLIRAFKTLPGETK